MLKKVHGTTVGIAIVCFVLGMIVSNRTEPAKAQAPSDFFAWVTNTTVTCQGGQKYTIDLWREKTTGNLLYVNDSTGSIAVVAGK